MINLQKIHRSYGAELAPDGIPLQYDLAKEYETALNTAVIFDRSHEGRLHITGKDRFELLNRMSTNKLIDMQADEGRATIFTNANARVIDRIEVYNRPDYLLVVTEPGQDVNIQQFLQRHIFFNDDVQLQNITQATVMFGIHGKNSDAIMAELDEQSTAIEGLAGFSTHIEDATIYVAKRKEFIGSHWSIIAPKDDAVSIYQKLMTIGEAHGLHPAGSLTYNTLRIRIGRPARPELNTNFIPLEIGLWDEVNFAKGCYTGQEIIARMESRQRLAKTMVSLELDTFVAAPADVKSKTGQTIGRMTSSVQAPNGHIFAIAVLKTDYISEGTVVQVGDTSARVGELLGTQPDFIQQS